MSSCATAAKDGSRNRLLVTGAWSKKSAALLLRAASPAALGSASTRDSGTPAFSAVSWLAAASSGLPSRALLNTKPPLITED